MTDTPLDVTAMATTWMVTNCPLSLEFLNLQKAYKAGFASAILQLTGVVIEDDTLIDPGALVHPASAGAADDRERLIEPVMELIEHRLAIIWARPGSREYFVDELRSALAAGQEGR